MGSNISLSNLSLSAQPCANEKSDCSPQKISRASQQNSVEAFF